MTESGFFYEGGRRREAVDALFDAVRAGRPLVLLTAPPGGGRSAVLAQFRQEADAEVLAVAHAAGDILMSPAQCFAALGESLAGLLPGDAGVALDEALVAVRETGRVPVLLLDDAHEIGEETRQSLLDLCAASGVTLVLAGDDTLPSLVAGRVGDAQVIALRPFTLEECEDFVAAWMQVTDEDDLPSHRVVARLLRKSGGWPGALVAALSADGSLRGPRFGSGLPAPVWHLAFAGAALVALVAYLASSGDDVAVPPPVPVQETPVALPGRPAAAATGNLAHGGESFAVPRPVDVVPLPAPAASMTAPGPEDTVPASPVVASPTTGPAARPGPAMQPAEQAGPAARQAMRPGRYSTDETALLAEKPSRFTLQLFASFNEQAARQFATRQPGVRVFRTIREDLDWFVVVSGTTYRNKDEAKAAVSDLPADLQKLKPWARSLQSIQDELRRRTH